MKESKAVRTLSLLTCFWTGAFEVLCHGDLLPGLVENGIVFRPSADLYSATLTGSEHSANEVIHEDYDEGCRT